MTPHFVFLLLGLANGAVFASLALALVVTYRSSGVINFATSGIALVSAYTYAYLRRGELLMLIPGFKRTFKLTGSMGFVPAFLITLLIAAVLGLILYGLVFRPLRTAPPVARAVASIGILVVLTGDILQRVGSNPVNVNSIFPTHAYRIGGVRVSADRIWFAVTIVAVALALAAAYRFTRFGLHTRAAAETEKGAFVSGISPDRIALFNWMISAAVAALAGILIAPIVPLSPAAYSLFIVPALAAAIMGRFQAMAVAVGVGLLIGMLQSEAAYLQSKYSWLPSSGLPEMIPLALILAVLIWRTQPLPARGELIRHSLGRAPRPHHLAVPTVVATVAAVIALVSMHGTWRSALVTSLIFGVISLSLVVVTGFAGQVSLAQLVLAGVAAFALSPLTASWGVPFPIAPIIAALFATVVGVVVGLPATRIRGLPLAVVTLALAVGVEAYWFRNVDFVSSSGKPITGPTLFGMNLRVGSGAAFPRLPFCFVVLVTLIATALVVARIRTSRMGSAMLAVRANERSAAASGINVVRTKLVAFAIASFIAGLGGTLLAYKQGNVTFDPFDAILGLSVFATAYLAGITSVSGGILAGVLGFQGLIYHFTDKELHLGDWYTAVTGVLLVFTVIQNPEGIVGPIHTKFEERRARRAKSPAPGAAELVGTLADASTTAVVSDETVLSLDSLRVRYGGVTAVDDVSFDVKRGQIVGLIGPNGAGKTTLIDAVCGFTRCGGRVSLIGRPLEGMRPFERARAGLARTFQAIELWDDLSVHENITAGMTAATGRAGPGDIDKVLALLGLTDVRERPPAVLSQGQRQLVSIARALVGRPEVLLLDEPAGGLDSAESRWLGERLRDVRASGVTILIVDHDMHLVLNLCDRIEVLNFGRLIASGSPSAIRADRAVADAYLGATHAAPVDATP
jgi:ABC-type branched-subunit amino acid transport system ATPase component/branched-subunit amino acid ABC-type transport system permease component